MRTIVDAAASCCRRAAEEIRRVLAERPDAVLALAGGRTMVPLFEELGRMVEAGELSLKEASVFAVTELEGAAPPLSCRRQIEEQLIARTDLDPARCHFLSAETAEGYDAAIEALGGIDIAVLGLGDNAHVGYNEPATPFESYTHRQKLTDATKRQLAGWTGSAEGLPDYGWTMGIKTLVSARQILLLAFGEEKAEPAFRMLYARTDSAVPAAFLQIPLNVTVYLDEAAAAKL